METIFGDYRINFILATYGLDLILGAIFVFYIKGRIFWKEERDDNGRLVDLDAKQKKERKEIIDVMVVYPIIHFMILFPLLAYGEIINYHFFENLYNLGRENWENLPSGICVLFVILSYIMTTAIKSLAYPDTNAKPIFWIIFAEFALFFILIIGKTIVEENKVVETDVITEKQTFRQPDGFPIDTVIKDATIVEWNLPEGYHWDFKCYNCETASLTDDFATFETKKGSRIIGKAIHEKDACTGHLASR